MRYTAPALDALVIGVCGLLSWQWFHADHSRLPHNAALLVGAACLIMQAFSFGLYRSWRFDEFRRLLATVALVWLMTAGVLVLWLFVTKTSTDYSRLWFGGWVAATLLGLVLLRLLVYSVLRWLRSKGYNYKSVVLVGQGDAVQRMEQCVQQASWSGLRVVARVMPSELAALAHGSPALELQLPESSHSIRLGPEQSPANRSRPVDEVWLCLPFSDEAGIHTALHALSDSTANIRFVPDLFSLKLINHGVSEVAGVPMLDLSTSFMSGPAGLLKACEDYIAATVILLVVSPLMLAIALAIKLSSAGPVLFKQRRHGWNGQQIWVYKFRTMVVHQEQGQQVSQATREDPRVTPLGAFLRRTSLDELPQFINVLQGRMSVVGPRPHAVAHNQHFKNLVPRYMLRHKVKPGVTGWAQINGFRGETDTLEKMLQRVEYDLAYIENWSLWLDLKIIFKTLFKGFVHRNAY